MSIEATENVRKKPETPSIKGFHANIQVSRASFAAYAGVYFRPNEYF